MARGVSRLHHPIPKDLGSLIVEYVDMLMAIMKNIMIELMQGWKQVEERNAKTVWFFRKRIGTRELSRKQGYIIQSPIQPEQFSIIISSLDSWEHVVPVVRKLEDFIVNVAGENFLPKEYAGIRRIIRLEEKKIAKRNLATKK